jgi:restriction system protein
MAIPDFQSLMLPLMKLAADNNEHASREATDSLTQLFQLSGEEKELLLPSGQQTVIGNRVYWALTHLRHAGLLESTLSLKYLVNEPPKSYLRKAIGASDKNWHKSY